MSTTLTKSERKQLIAKISQASGIAQYALLKKMTDEDVLQASQFLDAYQLLKSSNTYNRYCQGQKTKAANDRLKEFMNLQNSELVSAGKWLLNALSQKGRDRQQTLLEKDLVHKTDYNEAVGDMGATITELDQTNDDIITEAQHKIAELEKRIDTLRRQQTQIKTYIANNDGIGKWNIIAQTFQIKA